MVEETAEIEEPKLPGNYMARTNHRWKPEVNSTGPSGVHHEDVDEIHTQVSKTHVSPAQMYSTDSGRMFHAGVVCIVVVGLPGRGKTNLSIGLCRYLRWLGVRANLFHYGNYRRKHITELAGKDFLSLAPESKELAAARSALRKVVIGDMTAFFENDQGQVAIYDAVNGISSERLELVKTMAEHNVRTLFIESEVNNDAQLQENISDATKSPDYEGWDRDEAIADYTRRVEVTTATYQPMAEKELTWVRTVNFGQSLLINELKHDFLTTKIIFYLMNVKIKSGSLFFARCSNNKLNFKSDPPLTESGAEYISKMHNALRDHYKRKGRDGFPEDLEVWTSTRLRTVQAAQVFKKDGLVVRPRPEMTQLNPGDSEGLSDAQLQEKFPVAYDKHKLDPYHQRYPRSESYHDLALKLEPLILEAGRGNNDILIVADETVIRVFYGYLMASSSTDIPFLKFPQNEIIEITYNAYANRARRIDIPGVVPSSSSMCN